MKRSYESPRMKVHGKLEQITQVSGENATSDTLFFNGRPTGITSDDSSDFCLPQGVECDL